MKVDGHPLSNTEIESIVRKLNFPPHSFGGVFDQYQLPIFEPKFYVLNLDRPNGPGTHWILVEGTEENTEHRVYYFDPFGGPVLPNVKKWVPKESRVYYTDDTLQDMYSDMCGYYCIYIAYMMIVEHRDIDDIIMDDFSTNEEANDQIVLHTIQKLVR